jgi:hypothetical protein
MDDKQVVVEVAGMDLVDQTPILDIKPYIPYVDCIDDAVAGFAQQKPEALCSVQFSDHALQQLKYVKQYVAQYKITDFNEFVSQVLAQDPRPAYKKQRRDDKVYGVKLAGVNVEFCYQQQLIVVLDIKPLS